MVQFNDCEKGPLSFQAEALSSMADQQSIGAAGIGTRTGTDNRALIWFFRGRFGIGGGIRSGGRGDACDFLRAHESVELVDV